MIYSLQLLIILQLIASETTKSYSLNKLQLQITTLFFLGTIYIFEQTKQLEVANLLGLLDLLKTTT